LSGTGVISVGEAVSYRHSEKPENVVFHLGATASSIIMIYRFCTFLSGVTAQSMGHIMPLHVKDTLKVAKKLFRC